MASERRSKCLMIFFSLFGLVAFAGIITLSVVWQKKLTPFTDYALVIDAGSTHSKIFLYKWPADKSDGLGTTSRVQQENACSVPGGALTNLINRTTEDVKQYFQLAMENCTTAIPSNRKSRTLIFLAGTAGLRLFNESYPSATGQLLSNVRDYFASLGLLFRAPEYQVRIINGTEEGLAGWISTNMLMKQLFPSNSPSQTFGVSDLGGASTQISFHAPDALHDRYTMKLFDQNYDLYSHSFLCYGIEQVRRVHLGSLIIRSAPSLIIDDPCLQTNYSQIRTYRDIFDTPCAKVLGPIPSTLDPNSNFTFEGSGRFDVCRSALERRFNESICSYTTCSFDDVYQPQPISPDLKFVGISNGWYATFDTYAANLSLTKDSNENYQLNGTNLTTIKTTLKNICEQSWTEIPNPNSFRPFLCFNAMYQWTLFEFGYKMNDNNLKNFQIVSKIDRNEIGWTLGYMINQTNGLDAQFRPERLLTKGEFGGLLFLCIASFILSLIVIVVAFKSYKRIGYSSPNDRK